MLVEVISIFSAVFQKTTQFTGLKAEGCHLLAIIWSHYQQILKICFRKGLSQFSQTDINIRTLDKLTSICANQSAMNDAY